MRKLCKLTAFAAIAAIIFNIAGGAASAAFDDSGKHWYYSDDLSFKYWGLVDVNANGMPVNSDALKNISFDGATPSSIYQTGKEDYMVTAYVYQVPMNINVKIGLRGDVVSDGEVDLHDAIFIAEYLINKRSFESDFHEFIGDYNIDGSTDIYDVIDICAMIMQRTALIQAQEREQREKYIKEVFELVNKEREKAGLSLLTLDSTLCAAAQRRAVEISTQEDIEHTRPDGRTCFTVLDEMNIQYNYAGENIAGGYLDPEAVVKGWMESEGHRKNILDKYYTKIGIGFYYKANTPYQYYWTQFFIQNAVEDKK